MFIRWGATTLPVRAPRSRTPHAIARRGVFSLDKPSVRGRCLPECTADLPKQPSVGGRDFDGTDPDQIQWAGKHATLTEQMASKFSSSRTSYQKFSRAFSCIIGTPAPLVRFLVRLVPSNRVVFAPRGAAKGRQRGNRSPSFVVFKEPARAVPCFHFRSIVSTCSVRLVRAATPLPPRHRRHTGA
jgi:hypothetical protein